MQAGVLQERVLGGSGDVFDVCYGDVPQEVALVVYYCDGGNTFRVHLEEGHDQQFVALDGDNS